MRTTKLILTAVLAAAGVATASAQVTSVNVVGYINLTLTNGGYSMIANQLYVTNGNPINMVIPATPAMPSGLKILPWVGAGFGSEIEFYSIADLGADAGWYDANGLSQEPLNPGVSFLILNNSGANVTITLVGEVMQATPGNPISLPVAGGGNYSALASQVPQSLPLQQLGFPAVTGMKYLRFNFAGQAYDPEVEYYGVDTGADPVGWYDANGPVNGGEGMQPGIGEGFLLLNNGAATSWARDFHVN